MPPVTYGFTDRVVLITGATGGVGPAVARAFGAAGATLALAARNPEKLERLAADLADDPGVDPRRILTRPTDLTDPVAVRAMTTDTVDRFGRIDVLLNLVGSWEPGKVETTTDERWHQVLSTNLHAVFYAIREAVPHMGTGSAIVNVGSEIPVEGRGGQLAYAVAKGGVLTLTQSVAKELQARRIRVNAILPSNIDTPDNRRFRPNGDFTTWPSADEIARVLLFLASPEADLISGALVPVYGRSR
jgi:NAD(P)-dependent dehydrogenase (short-subunit alcohol dehydrogenase family)